MSYGLQGETWNYDANGRITATDWVLNNPDGWSWNYVMCIYAMNYLAEHGIKKTESLYMYPGSDAVYERMENARDFKADYAYDMPKGVTMTDEQPDEFFEYLDIVTYITEHAVEFVYGDRPFSEWGAYIEGLKSMGVDEATAVYQEAYDDYLAKVAKREV